MVLLFADDTKIFRVIRNREDYTALQSDLDLLQRWSQQWLLNFNISKCKHLHFGPAHHYGPYAPINVKPHPPQYGLCGALGGDLNLNFVPRGGEFEQAFYRIF